MERYLLEGVADKKVLFIGETIIDVYHYVKPLGRPLKEAIVSVSHIDTEAFDGGVMASATHARSFCGHVDINTGGDTVHKERWVEKSHNRKLFEMYTTKRFPTPAGYTLDEYDIVIVNDYGHGMFDEETIDIVCSDARFLCLNVQTNSGNYGFNLATRWPRADYLCVDETEARLAAQNRNGDIARVLEFLTGIAPNVVITLGKAGSVGIDDTGYYGQNAMTDTVVDTVGAGDAFFAVSSLVAEHALMESILKIGNAAAAAKCGIIGNRRSVTREEVFSILG